MAKITVEECPLDGVKVIRPTIHRDDRGYFFESFSKRDYEAAGISDDFVQDNQAASKHGVLRGMHFQKTHPQSKLVRCLSGKIYDVVVDLRKDSETFGQWFGIELSDENQLQLYIPTGFAHGYYVMSESAVFSYKCGEYYCPGDDGGILWNDPKVGIQWPIPEGEMPIILERDTRWPGIELI